MQEGSKGGEEIIALFGTTKICPRSEQNRRKEGPSAAASECESKIMQGIWVTHPSSRVRNCTNCICQLGVKSEKISILGAPRGTFD